jgi:hypothetical protein
MGRRRDRAGPRSRADSDSLVVQADLDKHGDELRSAAARWPHDQGMQCCEDSEISGDA